MDKLSFMERLLQLCRAAGYTEKEKNLPRKLARELINKGIVECNSDYGAEVDRIRCQIREDFNNSKHSNPPYNRIDWYCRLFNCSADFLLGYIDSPTHELKNICELLEIQENTAKVLMCTDIEAIQIKQFLNTLLANQAVINHLNPDSLYNLKAVTGEPFTPEEIADSNFANDVLLLFESLTAYINGYCSVKKIALDNSDADFDNKLSLPDNTVCLLFGENETIIGGFNSNNISSVMLVTIQQLIDRLHNYFKSRK